MKSQRFNKIYLIAIVLFATSIILSSCLKAKPIPNPSISLIVGNWQLFSTITIITYYDTTVTKDTGYSVIIRQQKL
jgi:hypothetical protein